MAAPDEPFVELDAGVFVRRHRSLDLNCGLVVGSDEALVIDTRATLAQGEDLRRAVRRVTALPVRWVVTTHHHWDHTFGTAAFPDAVVVGHRRVRELLLREGEREKQRVAGEDWLTSDEVADMRASPLVAPHVTFADGCSLHLGDREVVLAHHGRGHTDNDVVVHAGGVTFAGDLVEESAPPSFGDSHPDEWAPTLDRLLPTLRGVVVPGHGAVVDPAFVRRQRADVAATVVAARSGGPAPWPDAVVAVVRDRLAATAEG